MCKHAIASIIIKLHCMRTCGIYTEMDNLIIGIKQIPETKSLVYENLLHVR